MPRSAALLLTLLVLAGCAAEATRPTAMSASRPATAAQAPAPSAAVPVLLPEMSYSIGRSDPPAVRERKMRRTNQAMRLIRDAATAPVDDAGGCVRDRPTVAHDSPTSSVTWMPKRSEVLAAVVLGRQVQVDVRLPPRASSIACRVMGVTTLVTSGKDATFKSKVDRHYLLGRDRLAGTTVRFVTELPYGSSPPYTLAVNNETITAARSAFVRIGLECPPGGCLPPRDLSNPAGSQPRFAPTGVTTAELERSLRHVLAGEPTWVRTTSVSCASATQCRIELFDPAAKARAATTLAILGERRRGCWMGVVERSVVVPQDAEIVASASRYGPLGGCVAWTR